MNTVFPRYKKFHNQTSLQSFKAIELGNGYWGFVVGEGALLTRNIVAGVAVFGNYSANPPLKISKLSTGMLLVY